MAAAASFSKSLDWWQNGRERLLLTCSSGGLPQQVQMLCLVVAEGGRTRDHEAKLERTHPYRFFTDRNEKNRTS